MLVITNSFVKEMLSFFGEPFLLFFNYLIKTYIPIRQVRMTDEVDMSSQTGIGYPISIAEYLAKWSDPVISKHLNIHAFAYPVFDLFFFKAEMVISNAAIFYPVFMIRFIPYSYS